MRSIMPIFFRKKMILRFNLSNCLLIIRFTLCSPPEQQESPSVWCRACGVLINHLKELLLHTDLKRSDKILYITSCSWMMWNWLLSSLAVGATIVLYDGNPNYPDAGAMWKLIQDEKITMFGCSASYIHFLKKENIAPSRDYDLSSLREISQTGSPLSAEGFEYVYQ